MPGLHQGRLPGFQVSGRINQSSAAVEKNLPCEEFELSGATTVRAYMVGNGATGGNIVLMQVMRWTANGPRWGESTRKPFHCNTVHHNYSLSALVPPDHF